MGVFLAIPIPAIGVRPIVVIDVPRLEATS